MKKTVKISRSQAREMFLSFKKYIAPTGVSFLHFTYFIDVSESKTVNGQKMLQKLVSTNVTVGADYEIKSQKILTQKEGKDVEFKAQDAPDWLEYIGDEGSPMTRHKTKGTEYVTYMIENHTVTTSELYLEGEKKTRAEVWNPTYITDGGLKKKETTSARGMIEAENNFFFRRLTFDSLLSFTVNKTLYIIED